MAAKPNAGVDVINKFGAADENGGGKSSIKKGIDPIVTGILISRFSLKPEHLATTLTS